MAAGMAKQPSMTKVTNEQTRRNEEQAFTAAFDQKLEKARIDAMNKDLEKERMESEAEKREFKEWLAQRTRLENEQEMREAARKRPWSYAEILRGGAIG